MNCEQSHCLSLACDWFGFYTCWTGFLQCTKLLAITTVTKPNPKLQTSNYLNFNRTRTLTTTEPNRTLTFIVGFDSRLYSGRLSCCCYYHYYSLPLFACIYHRSISSNHLLGGVHLHTATCEIERITELMLDTDP